MLIVTAGQVKFAVADSIVQQPVQWTEPAGKLLVDREPAWRRLGH